MYLELYVYDYLDMINAFERANIVAIEDDYALELVPVLHKM